MSGSGSVEGTGRATERRKRALEEAEEGSVRFLVVRTVEVVDLAPREERRWRVLGATMISASGLILAKPVGEESALEGSTEVRRMEAVEVGER